MSLKFNNPLLRPLSKQFVGPLLFVVFGAAALVVLFAVLNPLSASKSVLNTNGHYSIHSPILISHAPKIVITEGALRFVEGETNSKDTNLFTGLPLNWIDKFISNKFSHIALDDAVITIDFRGQTSKNEKGKANASSSPKQLVHLALQKSQLESLSLTNSKLILLRDFSEPLSLQIKKSKFELDLGDAEIEGQGLLTTKKGLTEFSLSHDFSDKNSKGIRLNALSLSLNNKHFNANFEGVLEGRTGLHFKGETTFNFKDIFAWNFLRDLETKQIKDDRSIRFSGGGSLHWSGIEGTLTKGTFKFGQNAASGSLNLKLSQANPEISGTLAFKNLYFSELYPQKRRKTSKGTDATNQEIDEALINRIKVITPLIREYDADLRISANRISLKDVQLDEVGFSLFQKKGELLIDMAGASLFNGAASGLLKIDTNSPKPRLHVNAGFTNVDLSKLNDAWPEHSYFNGLGHLKLKLTSYGDKGQEIYENMFGSLEFAMPQGGDVHFNLKEFLGEQEHNSEQSLKKLGNANSPIKTLTSIAHFSKGAIIFDHFMISTVEYDFTGNGFLNFKSLNTNWNIATWDKSDFKSSNEQKNTAQETQKQNEDKVQGEAESRTFSDGNKDEIISTPILLTCSHITGSLDNLEFEKFTALHLSLLNRACPAFYHFDQLKTKDTPIVQTDNAG